MARKDGKNKRPDLCIGSSPPLSNIFYLLQILAPGMFVIHHEYQTQDADVKVSRVLPRPTWIEINIETKSKMDALAALLAAAKDRKIAFHEERTARPRNKSHLTLPVVAKKQKMKNASHKKKQPRNNNSTYTAASTSGLGYLNPRDDDISSGQGYEWGMCDKDCGWCGRCILNYHGDL